MALATAGGIGLLPGAPGTWASAAAMAALLIPVEIRHWILLVLIVLLTVVSIPAINRIEARYGDDPGFVVIDEIIGMWTAFLLPEITLSAVWVILLFCFYRIFDILKPWPLNILNAKRGAIYVIADDVGAAIMAVLAITILKTGAQIAQFVIFDSNI
jgi:phosphatidylglycerophosphatase A